VAAAAAVLEAEFDHVVAALEERQARTPPDTFAHLVNQSRLTAARGTVAWLSDYVGHWPKPSLSTE
jgi:hypothetical protein